ncbi:hypothetical protein GCM10009730_44960 [Streptomyces albidochromogenes]|uniref:hypothetical protein n=1 Tax=Streptomyces albidochromogenes TaxID=329524 RepID=UPI00110FA250|nr:hypothetical protein [Streptomyces albidochromogenes]
MVGGFLGALGQKLAERWLTLLVLPGALLIVTATVSRVLGHAHALDHQRLIDRIGQWAQAPVASSVGGQVVLLGAVLAAAAVAGLAAQALGTLVQRAVLAAGWRAWPRPFRQWVYGRVVRRRARWGAAAQRYRQQLDADARSLALLGERADSAPRRAAHQAMHRVGAEEPDRPTWSGDRVHAVSARLERDHHLDLPLVWPHLWLMLPETTRAEITAAEQALTRASTLGGWAALYAPLAVWWWPAAPVAGVLALTARFRLRGAVDAYAQLLEAAVRLHAVELAEQLGIEHAGPLDRLLGDALSQRLRTRPREGPPPS